MTDAAKRLESSQLALTFFVALHEEALRDNAELALAIAVMPRQQAQDFLEKVRRGCEYWMTQFSTAVDVHVATITKVPGAPQG